VRFLLDTNIISDAIRNPRGAVRVRLDQVGTNQVVTSIIVAAELRYGVAKRRSASLADTVEKILGSFAVLPFEHPADFIYGKVRSVLEAAGTPISNNDMLIAAHALALDCILVTDNVREFSRIDGLAVENWLR
jgi:tRNA(fMet)-specific endonuclease VapC